VIVIRNITQQDIHQIINLQKKSFEDMAEYGMIWPSFYLKSHIDIFPEGQFCAEIVYTNDGRNKMKQKKMIVGSASSLIVTLEPPYAEHTWYDITGHGMFLTHDTHGDSLYGADISTHPQYQRQGIASMLYDARKDLAKKLNLRRIIAGGRLYYYYKYADKISPLEYVNKSIGGEIKDPVLSFQLKNGFRFIKILPNYLYDKKSLNYAAFIELLNSCYKGKKNENELDQKMLLSHKFLL
jgi:ribosomal protein S18 acetylase RimI-like enzyme